jgi:hypothetical protein
MVDPMIDLDRRYGIWSGRVWGLIVNLLANALALYGLAGYLRDGTHLFALWAGFLISLGCILLLAKPAR